MDFVDDSDGYYGGEFCSYLDEFLECIDNAGLASEERKKYIKYIFDKYLEKEPDYFQDDYHDALRKLCTSREDLQYWRDLLEPHLPEGLPDREKQWIDRFQAVELISMQMHILRSLGERELFYKLIEKHYKYDVDFLLLYAEQLKEDGRLEEATRVAEDGIGLFAKNSGKLRVFLGAC